MKKFLIALCIIVLITGTSYTVYNYNNTIKNIPDKNATAAAPPASSTSKTLPGSQKLQGEKIKLKAIDFKLKDLKGNDVSLSDFKGKKVFLNFWATWCPPCRKEMPEMEAYYQKIKDSDVVMLVVNLGENKSTVENFIKDNKYNFPVLLDTDNKAAVDYRIASIPTSFFIDKDGNIIFRHIGPMTVEDMEAYIENTK
jgi:thiol-disulfide isomerase/thioredoxin